MCFSRAINSSLLSCLPESNSLTHGAGGNAIGSVLSTIEEMSKERKKKAR